MTALTPLLSIRDLRIEIRQKLRVGHPVDLVSYDLMPNETLGIVGESGSGKSLHILGILGLLPSVARVVSGQALFQGRDLLRLSPRERRQILGREIGMVFQDPMTSLNPVLTIGEQICEGIEYHLGLGHRAARARAGELLELVEIRDPMRRLDQYPHELSGGMRQRVMIAIALSCEPKLLIADEATTALDVTVQSQVVDLVMDLKARLGMAVIWVSHDMGIIARLSDRVQVMYGGQIMESGPVHAVFDHPQSAYTYGLLKSIPEPGQTRDRPLFQIEGTPPNIFARPPGDPFAPRNPFATPRCHQARPPLRQVVGAPDHWVAAWYDLDQARAEAGTS